MPLSSLKKEKEKRSHGHEVSKREKENKKGLMDWDRSQLELK